MPESPSFLSHSFEPSICLMSSSGAFPAISDVAIDLELNALARGKTSCKGASVVKLSGDDCRMPVVKFQLRNALPTLITLTLSTSCKARIQGK